MTAEEIKQTYTMRDIVERYGFRPDRSGFIRCPFHNGDHTASFKIYKDNFYCYGCGATGDIFKFVMLIDGVSFKDAFLSLGGEYPKDEKREDRIHRKRDLLLAQQKRDRENAKLEEKRIRMKEIGEDLNLLTSAERLLDPMSEWWCYAVDRIPKVYDEWLQLWEEVNEK